MELSQIDPGRDLFAIKYMSKDPSEAARDVVFSTKILDWQPTNLKMKIEFNDPLLISQGPSSDLIIMMLKRPELFAPEGSDELLDEGSLKLEVMVPRQLPPGVSAEKVEESAGGAKNSVLAIMVVRVLTQVFMKGSLDHIIGLFLSLQIICYIMNYNILLPSIT